MTTANADDHVVPAHSFKYTAALRPPSPAATGPLIGIDARAGDGAGKPIAQALDEIAAMWAFAARWTGLRVNPINPINQGQP